MIRDLFFAGILGAFFLIALRRPFLFVPLFIYADLVRPQYLTYWLLQPVPISQILFFCAFGFWLLSRHKAPLGWGGRLSLIVLLLFYCGVSTLFADFPESAVTKWEWVWKVIAFAVFLPFTLSTRLRIEAVILVIALSASSNIVTSGIKTLFGGGRYGAQTMLINGNSGMYESSTFACIAIAIVPLIACLLRQGTVFPSKSWLVRLYGAALIFACLLVPIGTEARTGLVCIVMLGISLIRFAKRPVLYLATIALLSTAALPLLPASFMERMSTIRTPTGDSSASTRLAVWRWTIDYAKDHPLGGGFNAYLGNDIQFDLALEGRLDADNQSVAGQGGTVTDKARAYHSSYFEMLGEQGWPGLGIWLSLNLAGLIRMEQLLRRHRRTGVHPDEWLATMALGLQQAHIIFLTGALFVGIAFNPFVFHLLGLEIALGYLSRRVVGRAQGIAFASPVPRSGVSNLNSARSTLG